MKKILKILIAPLGIIIFVVAIMLLSNEMKSYSYQQILDTLRAIPSIKIICALILALSYYLILGGYDVIAFKFINVPLKFKNEELKKDHWGQEARSPGQTARPSPLLLTPP